MVAQTNGAAMPQSKPRAKGAQPVQLTEQSSGEWRVSGDINFESVIELRRLGIDALSRSNPICRFDFAAVGSVNTMAISLILCWSRAAKQAGIELQLSNIPSELHAIAELSDLQSLVAPS